MKKLKILHVFPDNKFLDVAFDTFDCISNVSNEYVFYFAAKDYRFKYIKNTIRIKIETDIEEYKKLFYNPDIDVIFFHTLDYSKYEYLSWIDSKKIVVWSAWGYDIYSPIGEIYIIKLDLFKPLTYKLLFDTQPSLFKQLKRLVKRFLHIQKEIDKIKTRRWFKKYIKQSIQRVDFCATVLDSEYSLLKKTPYFKSRPFYFKYLINANTGYSIGNSILLGNSADPTNNHLDILDKLRQLNISNRNVIIPLNYGDEGYKKKLIEKLNLEKNLYILDDFLPITEYEKKLLSSSVAIFGHIRQQALGNIMMCFERGIKVFLYKDSITYKQLKKDGYFVFEIENLTQKEIDTPLTEQEKEHNHKLYLQEFSSDVFFDRFNSSINEVRIESERRKRNI